MAVTWSEEIPLDRITEEARKVRFWRTVLLAVAGLLFGLGWVACRTSAATWLIAVWVATAVRVGWQEARRGRAARSD